MPTIYNTTCRHVGKIVDRADLQQKNFYAIIYFPQTLYQIPLLILSIIYIVNEIVNMYNFVLCVNENKNKGKADESL